MPHAIGAGSSESGRANSMHSRDDKTVVHRIGAADLVVTSDRAGLVDAISTRCESRSRVVECDRGAVRASQESMMRFSVGPILSDDETALVDVIHQRLRPG